MHSRKTYYMNKYGAVPSFKASIHTGEVTISEVGVSKKEIVYHGDTINTAARIRSSAHTLSQSLPIAEAVRDQLDADTDLIFDDLGEHAFKDRDEMVHVYGVTANNQ